LFFQNDNAKQAIVVIARFSFAGSKKILSKKFYFVYAFNRILVYTEVKFGFRFSRSFLFPERSFLIEKNDTA